MHRLTSVLLVTLLACSGTPDLTTFTSTQVTTSDGVAVSFVADLPDAYDRVRWDFGDGTSSTKPQPTHVYNRNARYSVVLTVETGNTLASVPEFVSVETNPLPPPSVMFGFANVEGRQVHAVNLLQLAPIGGSGATAGARSAAYAFRRDADGTTTIPFGGVPSITFRPASDDLSPTDLVFTDGLLTATLDRPQAYSPAWFLDGELFAPSSEQMPLMKGIVPIVLDISPSTGNASRSLSTGFTVQLAGEVDISTIDEVVYVLRGQKGLLSFRVENATGHAPQVIPASELATLGQGVCEVYATVRNVRTSTVEGVPLTVVNAATTWGAVVFTP